MRKYTGCVPNWLRLINVITTPMMSFLINLYNFKRKPYITVPVQVHVDNYNVTPYWLV